jgi:hypothetical protein
MSITVPNGGKQPDADLLNKCPCTWKWSPECLRNLIHFAYFNNPQLFIFKKKKTIRSFRRPSCIDHISTRGLELFFKGRGIFAPHPILGKGAAQPFKSKGAMSAISPHWIGLRYYQKVDISLGWPCLLSHLPVATNCADVLQLYAGHLI